MVSSLKSVAGEFAEYNLDLMGVGMKEGCQ
jgi:hypothetical protein